jgi:hypothetical protein
MEIPIPLGARRSVYECDCGHKSHFFERTVKEMKRMSKKEKVRLADSEKKTTYNHISKWEGHSNRMPKKGEVCYF